MRVLFLPLITRGSAIGTISRCLAVACALRRAGHEACFLTNAEGLLHVKAEGFAHAEGSVPAPPSPLGHRLCCLADVAVFLNLTGADFIRRSLTAEAAAVERFKPDVLFSEFKLTASITAARFGLPLVSTACSPADPRFVSPLFAQGAACPTEAAVCDFNVILAEHGLPPVGDVGELFFGRSQVKIAPTAPEIEPLLADVPGLTYVGFLLHEAWERGPLDPDLLRRIEGRQPVYVYLGMGQIGPREYLRVAPEAFDGTEFFAVMAVGDHPDLPGILPETANTLCRRFVPAGSMLQRSRVLVFHGGQNTAMASLLHGVPSLVFPGLEFERDFNARGLATVGAGRNLPVGEFTPSRLLALCRQAATGDGARAAARMGRKIAALGGPERAAALVLDAGRAPK